MVTLGTENVCWIDVSAVRKQTQEGIAQGKTLIGILLGSRFAFIKTIIGGRYYFPAQ